MTAVGVPAPAMVRPNLSGLRVLVVHEWLYTWAGAERCLHEIMGLIPDADLVVGVVTQDARSRFPVAGRAKETWLGRIPGARRHHRWFLPLHALAFATIDTSRYDLVLSLSHSMGKLAMRRKGAAHLCYCFSPPRYLWDLRATYGRHAPLAQSLALRVGGAPLRALDRWGASRVDRFVSISQCVADRVLRAYGRQSDVVYPPVTAKSSVMYPRERFLLSLGRLVPYKRVDLVIRAAERLQLKLVVAGDGPERQRLERLAGPQTEFRGQVTEEEAGRLMSSCAAFVFCAEEDFGIAPVEANAHGAPVVAFGRGGAAETIVDGRTGILFGEQSEAAVVAAIERCLRRTWISDELRANAARFSTERFREGIAAQISAAATSLQGRST
jgi:glycosyltransferase involved in cell wall biosynthesis